MDCTFRLGLLSPTDLVAPVETSDFHVRQETCREPAGHMHNHGKSGIL